MKEDYDIIYSSYSKSYNEDMYEDYAYLYFEDFYNKVMFCDGDFRELISLRNDVLQNKKVDDDRRRAGYKALLPFQKEWLTKRNKEAEKKKYNTIFDVSMENFMGDIEKRGVYGS